MSSTRSPLGAAGLLALLASQPACMEEAPPPPPPRIPTAPAPTNVDPGPAPFEPVSPAAALGKVKSVLTGLPPTDAELQAVTADPTALRGLIDRWMSLPEFQGKMLAFFRNAFQQNQVGAGEVLDALGINMFINEAYQPLLDRSLRDSFPRTAWQIVAEGRPFTEVLTTRRFMVTPPLLTFMMYVDQRKVPDGAPGGGASRISQRPGFKYTLTNDKPIPAEQSGTAGDPSYLTFYDPQAPALASCMPGQYPRVLTDVGPLVNHYFGKLQAACSPAVGRYAPVFADAEWDSWRPVSFRQAQAGEDTSPDFFDLRAMRGAGEVVVRSPKTGFFTTPAFFGNWPTNVSNQARVTINQTLIVALGRSFDGANVVNPVSETGLNAEHAAPGTECYGCHRTLDPMRQFFRQAFTLSYSEQLDAKQNIVNGVFAFDGVTRQGAGFADLGATLAEHPRFAAAWAQKLCYYANSGPCGEDDPEFQRVAGVFAQSKFDFKALVRELFSSPLVTGLKGTETFAQDGLIVSIARRNHLCSALSNRLGLADVCGQETPRRSAAQGRVAGLAVIIQSDGYSRGSEAAITSTDPELFWRASVENVCRAIADQVVDAPVVAGAPPSRYSSKDWETALTDLTQTVMGLPPSDERYPAARQILSAHYFGLVGQALPGGQKIGAADALKSTFVLACMSPPSVILGL